MRRTSLRAGDYVEVRSREEILATLDDDGCLEKLPFMPEMLNYCGKRFRIASSAHKTCDTINKTGGRRMKDAVHLESTRCDGAAHGGCQAGCLIFWKYEWLKRPSEDSSSHHASTHWDQARLEATTQRADATGVPIYRCQATCLFAATKPLAWWDVRQYVRDLVSKNVNGRRFFGVFCFATFNRIVKIGFGYRILIKAYNWLQAMRSGLHYPVAVGRIAKGSPTPIDTLSLEPGEEVRVKSHEEILSTLDRNNKNRGLLFDPEMVPYCGKKFHVHYRVNKIIDESTGKMIDMKAPCIVLDNVFCKANYSNERLFCPRAIYSYWRESWLERVPHLASEDAERGS